MSYHAIFESIEYFVPNVNVLHLGSHFRNHPKVKAVNMMHAANLNNSTPEGIRTKLAANKANDQKLAQAIE